jgi:hypothetical protein
MRISKIIVALLASVIAVTAMTGVAVAEPSTTISPDNIDVDIATNAATIVTITHTCVPTTEWWADGICFNISRDVPSWVLETDELEGSLDSGTSWTVGSGCLADASNYVDAAELRSYTWTCDIRDAFDTDDDDQIDYEYTAEFQVYNTSKGSGDIGNATARIGSSTTTIDPIPEFATIAIPAIAVLGLFLFFNKRKHKKD